MEELYHEEIARTDLGMRKLKNGTVVVCGAGALGSNIVENLAKSGVGHIFVYDNDRVETRNISTQTYGRREVGMQKVKALAARIYRDTGVKITAKPVYIDQSNADGVIQKGCSHIVVDAFDNAASRRLLKEYCLKNNIACVHAGMADGYSEVIWNEDYTVPQDVDGEDVCEYPLARTLAVSTAAFASEAVMRYIIDGEKLSIAFTLQDLRTGRP